MDARAMGLRLRLHRANGGALRRDSRRELSRKLFGRADRLAFFERTLKTSIARDGAETAHPRTRCCLRGTKWSPVADALFFILQESPKLLDIIIENPVPLRALPDGMLPDPV